MSLFIIGALSVAVLWMWVAMAKARAEAGIANFRAQAYLDHSRRGTCPQCGFATVAIKDEDDDEEGALPEPSEPETPPRREPETPPRSACYGGYHGPKCIDCGRVFTPEEMDDGWDAPMCRVPDHHPDSKPYAPRRFYKPFELTKPRREIWFVSKLVGYLRTVKW